MITSNIPDVSLRGCTLADVQMSGDRLRLRIDAVDSEEDREQRLVDVDLFDVSRVLCNGHEVPTFEVKMPDCEILDFERRNDGCVVMPVVWTDFARKKSSIDIYQFS